MIKSLPIRIITVFLVICMIGFILVHRHTIQGRVQGDLQEQVQVVARSLWNIDPNQSQKYLDVVAEHYRYHSLIIRDITGAVFIESNFLPNSFTDRLFTRLGLFPVTQFSRQISYNGQVIGTIEVAWSDQSIYLYVNLIFFGILFLFILQLYNRLLQSNRELEGTVSRRTEKLQQAQRETLKGKVFTDAVIQSLPGIFYVYNSKFKLIRWNNNHEQESGYTGRELAGRDLFSWFSRKERRKLQEKMRSMDGNNFNLVMELRPVWKNGIVNPYLFSSTSIIIEGERYFIGTALNISDRKKMEDELRQALKMEAIGTLAGGIAHDFNNILAAILGYTELSQMLEEGEAVKLAEYLASIHSSALRAKELVQQILTFSRKSTRQQIVLEVELLVRETLKLLRSTIPANVTIVEEFNAGNASILADPTQIHQIVMNLCTNAYHAIGSGNGTITVRLEKVDYNLTGSEGEKRTGSSVEVLHLQVADNGCGMDSQTLAKIFDPYFTTKGVSKGTGLGLSMVHGIIESLEGDIQARSVSGKGTVFDIYLPLTNSEKPKKENVLPQESRPVNTAFHLLCVDDEPHVLGVVRDYLTGLGYQVTCRSNPTEALEELKQFPEKYSILITDMTMPAMNGIKLASQILRLNPELPVILCTGYSADINREKALALGLKGYIEKPIDLALLGRSVAAALPD